MDMPVAQPSRSMYNSGVLSDKSLFVKSFETPQQALSSGSDDPDGEQVVPAEELSGIHNGKIACPLPSLDLSLDRYSAEHLDRSLELEEKMLVSEDIVG